MATQLLLGSPNDPTAQGSVCPIPGESRPPENSKRGRKSGKQQNGSIKKQPQRGMGVAQLERLRQQERWKMMAEINSAPSLQYSGTTPYPYNFDPPTTGVPIHQLPKFGAGGFGVIAGGAHHGFPPAVVHSGGEPTSAHFFQGGFGGFDPNGLPILGSSGLESLKELPSIPKRPEDGEIDRNSLIWKKKRISGYETAFMEGITEKHEGVEVVAVHRKGKAVGGAVVMEYGFFPARGGGGGRRGGGKVHSNSNINDVSPSGASSMATSIATEVASCSLFGSDEASIDLSLRL
ncbi:hypothetical protein Ancab_025288 [Ancistrocladus abbreviatus]